MNIVFRADSSSEIGAGHIMRCLTLADELVKDGAKIQFICRDLVGHLGKLIIERGFDLVLLQAPGEISDLSSGWLKVAWEKDADETINALQGKTDLLIVDHYGIDIKWHKKIAENVNKIMVIDDLANRMLHCDLLLDQTFGRKDVEYSNCIDKKTNLLCGTKYALLRPQFSEKREKAIKRREGYSGIRRILISFGGADLNNHSGHVLDILSEMNFIYPLIIDVVLGSSAATYDSLIEQTKGYRFEVNILSNVNDMAELMLQADLAIGAGGTTSWERCTLALPTILIVDASNQELIAKNLEIAGAVYVVNQADSDDELIKKAIQELDNDIKKYRTMCDSAANICDGTGVKIVAAQLASLI